MYDVSLMEVFDSAACLDHEPPNLWHGEIFPLLDGVGERTVFAELKDNVGAFDERKGAVKLDNVRMG